MYEIISLIFPQFKNIYLLKNLNKFAKENIKNVDFTFLISLMIVDGSDNPDYFIYKFNLSKKDQKTAMEQLKKIDPKLQAAGNKKILTKSKISRIQKRLNSRVADIAKK